MSEHPGDLLSALLDGELDERERDQVEAHLEQCPACRGERAAVAAARAWVRALPSLEPDPSALHLPSLGRVVPLPRRHGRGAWVAAAAAAVALAGLGAQLRDGPTVRQLVPLVRAHAGTVPTRDPVTEMGPVIVPVSFRP